MCRLTRVTGARYLHCSSVYNRGSHRGLERLLGIPAEQAFAFHDVAAFFSHDTVCKVAQLVVHDKLAVVRASLV